MSLPSLSQLALLFTCLLALSEAQTLQCNVLNTIPGLSTMTCSPSVYQCMKFVCRLNGGNTISKGCNDPTNPVTSSSTLINNCQAQGGKGKLYVCNGSFCNASATTSLSSVLALLLGSLLVVFVRRDSVIFP